MLCSGGPWASGVSGEHAVLDTQWNGFNSRLVHHPNNSRHEGCFVVKNFLLPSITNSPISYFRTVRTFVRPVPTLS